MTETIPLTDGILTLVDPQTTQIVLKILVAGKYVEIQDKDNDVIWGHLLMIESTVDYE